MSMAELFGEFECAAGFDAGCITDAATGQPLSNIDDADWALDQLRFEDRGGAQEPVT